MGIIVDHYKTDHYSFIDRGDVRKSAMKYGKYKPYSAAPIKLEKRLVARVRNENEGN